MKKVKLINIIILLCIITYVLDVFIVSPDTGSIALLMKESFSKLDDVPIDVVIWIYKIIGMWGGHVSDFLGFDFNLFLSGEYWRAFTVIFTHSQLIHLITNLIAFYILGRKVEEKCGFTKTLILIISISFFSSFLTTFIYNYILGYPISIIKGLSDIIYAFMGIMLVVVVSEKKKIKTLFSKKEVIYLVVYILISSFLLGFFYNNWFSLITHLCGFIIGIISFLILLKFKNKV